MSQRAACLLATVLALTSAPSLATEFAYDQFAPSVIGTIAADTRALNLPGTGKKVMYAATVNKVRVTVTYVGTSRPLTSDESMIVHGMANAIPGAPTGYAELYREAFAFDDAGRRYWLPVQQPVANYFAKELKAGQRLQLFAVVAGGVAEKDGAMEPVLLVQEFNGEVTQGRLGASDIAGQTCAASASPP